MREESEPKGSLHPWPLNILEREWPKVKSAPASFVLIAFVFLVLGGAGMHFLYSIFLIPGLEQTIAQKDATIEELKEHPKTEEGTSNVADQSKRIASLEKELHNLRTVALTDEIDPEEWSPLTQAQMDSLQGALKNIPPRTVYVAWVEDLDARYLFRSLKNVLTKCGWNVGTMTNSPTFDGVEIIAVKDDPAALALMTELKKDGFPCRITVQSGWDGSTLDIFIGDKPSP